MEFYQITPPNICALIVYDDPEIMPAFIEAPPEAITGKSPNTSWEQFTTKEAAATRAVEIYPSYNVNIILGGLTLEAVNVSPSQVEAYAGSSVTLNCEYSCGDCEVVYEWLNPGGLPIPGATQSHLTLNNLTEKLDGVYTCNASAQNEKGQTGSANGSFKVTVYPAIVPGAVAE